MPAPESKTIQCRATPGFAQWMANSGGSIAITTYQGGKVVLVGWNGAQVSVTARDFPVPMGFAAKGDQLALATRDDLILFHNAKFLAENYLGQGRYDALFLPRLSFHTGPLNLHDLAYGTEALWAVNTRFCCLVHLNALYSFVPMWQPHFIRMLAREDRCHLNGLALVEGKPRFVTALGKTDVPRGWVERKATGGILMEVETNQVILDGLCMPHSPRWHQNKVWFLNSGLGELWTFDVGTGTHRVIAQLPAYLRGLSFVGPFALVGMSKVRAKHIFSGLPVQERCPNLICGAAIVDTRNGQCVGILEFTDAAEELYDVVFLPKIQQPAILNRAHEDSHRAITAPEFAYWFETKEIPEKKKQTPDSLQGTT